MTRRFRPYRFLCVTAGCIALAFGISELVLRVGFGFCDAPLVVESDRYEYAFAPDQDRHRFGSHISYNRYSQRSENPDSTKTLVLGLGDSVINGGVLTDNDELATTLASSDSIQILNISAGSWGPDNCAAYLEEKGTFGATAMLLVVSSHDAYDNMTFEPIVGRHKSYPSRQYSSAIWELVDRYLIPRFFPKSLSSANSGQNAAQGVGIEKGGMTFNPGFYQLKSIADENGMEMYLYLHPDLRELSDGKFDNRGMEIIGWAAANGVEVSTGFEYGETPDDFRDGIHLNERGQRKLARWMTDVTTRLEPSDIRDIPANE